MTDLKHLTNFVSVWLTQILSMAIPVIIILSLGRFYSVEEFGIYSVATSFMGAFGIFLTFGVANAVSYEAAVIDKEAKKKMSGIIVSGVIVFASFSIAGFFIIAIALFVLKYHWGIVLIIIMLGFGYWMMGARSLFAAVFLGMKEMSFTAIPAFGVLLATIIFVVPTIYFHKPLWQIAIVWSCCQGVGLVVILWLLYKKGFLTKPQMQRGQTFYLFKRSIGIGLDSVIYRLGANLTNILLPVYLTSYQIGVFNGAFKPFTLLVLGNQCCIQFFSPYIASERYRTKEAIENKLDMLHKLSTFFTLTILIIPLFFANSLCRLIFGDHLAVSAAYMQILTLGYLLYYIPPYSAPLKAIGLEWKVLWSSVTQVIVNLLGLIVLVPMWGIKGAVFSVVLAFTSYWIVNICLYRMEGLTAIKNNVSKYLGFALLTILSGWLIKQYVTQGLAGIILFLIAVIVLSLVVYWSGAERRMAFAYLKKLIGLTRDGK
ncbi:MAG: oligosaccharide flippase family protein [Deltaproteobacteria bacterium]|nr:oligosaccharide flippase family protein [Deltaproteobacteria bacterium]